MVYTQDDIPHTLVARLTHCHAIDSPYFDPTRSIKDLAEIDLKSSIHRASYLTANFSSLLHLTDIESELTPNKEGSGYLASLQVGSKNVDQHVTIDTGSSLLWLNCEPCGYNVPGPLFHPKESSTYEVEDCNQSDICAATGAASVTCNYYENKDVDENGCAFRIQYGREKYSAGDLAREHFKFGSSTETLKNFVFGCSRKTNLYTNGVLGLGMNPLSLVQQRGASKFSYCLGNISDRSYAYNTLAIGEQLTLRGPRTPMIMEDKYYINLEGIKIGDVSLNIDPQMFKRVNYEGGMVVDTGSTYSFIPGLVLKKFEEEVIKIIESRFEPVEQNYSFSYRGYQRLCYNGILTRDLTQFPIVQLRFQGDKATMELIDQNLFQQITYDNFCLAILPSETLGTTMSILGNLMQQYFYIAYDLRAQKLSFQGIDCGMIDSYINDEL